LRVVSDVDWSGAHTRLATVRAKYLTSTEGRVYGRPHDVESKDLLPWLPDAPAAAVGCMSGPATTAGAA